MPTANPRSPRWHEDKAMALLADEDSLDDVRAAELVARAQVHALLAISLRLSRSLA